MEKVVIMVKNVERNNQISNLIADQIYVDNNIERDEVLSALEILLNGNYKKYVFDIQIKKPFKNNLQNDLALSKFNEKTPIRKEKGVYYTPQDLTNYIDLNAMLTAILDNNNKTYKDYKAIETILEMDDSIVRDLIFNKTFFDPTCGSGEFLITTAELKIKFLKSKFSITDENILKIAQTIYGNDISEESADVAMFRLFNCLSKFIVDHKRYTDLGTTIKSNFSTYDFVNYKNQIKKSFDIILGNPPYIEYGKYLGERNNHLKYGNVYADVVHNTINLIKPNGALGFVLPLSYVATNRMSNLREEVIENFNTQFVLSFADRPDCLFAGVHQKLCILIAKKGREEHRLFTSKYNIWRKDERNKLLNGCEIIRVFNGTATYIPKIGNSLEESIFRKVRTVSLNNIFDSRSKSGDKIYLNMRAAFWIKAFSFNPGSKEYKELTFPLEKKNFILAVLNSSLYWMFWTIVSDGWHITSKELKEFLVPDKNIDYQKFDKLVSKLEEKLEKTKKYICTKQTEYEYKHKECKSIIDKIDDALAEIYALTPEELTYVKKFYQSYRIGEKND